MKDLVILFEALDKMGYDLDPLNFQEGVNLKAEIEKVIKVHGVKKINTEVDVSEAMAG